MFFHPYYNMYITINPSGVIMLVRRLLLLTLIVSALAISGCPWDDDDGDASDQGGDVQEENDPIVPDPECVDPCEGELLFGPETFDRSTCEPVTETRSFEVANAGDVCIVVSNAGNAAAWIYIDGIKYLKPNHFNPNVTDLTETVALTAGTHELTVRVASIPGTSITVELRACDDGAPPQRLCSAVAREYCESKGWIVVSDPNPSIGNIVCTVDGRGSEDNCSGCSEYNMVVWENGSPEQHCAGTYSTVAGTVYGGHIPCICADNLYWCQPWDTQGCSPD